MNKVYEYGVTTLALARQTGISPLIVFIKAVLARARYGIGIKYFNLYGLAEKNSTECGQYMHLHEASQLQSKLNGSAGQEICSNKLLFHQKCVEFGLPTPRILGCLSASKKKGVSHGVPLIESGDNLLKLLAKSGKTTFIFKPASSAHGEGLNRFSISDGKIFDDNGDELIPDNFIGRLQSKVNLYILQPALIPHKALKPLMPGKGLGTVRMVTINRHGNAKVEFACLKIPVGDTIADNFVGGMAGNFLAEIDLVTGVIGATVGPAKFFPGLIEPRTIHPDSHAQIPGFRFPLWNDMLALAKNATEKFDFLYTIGWDISLTEDGPCLIEANSRYDVDILQIAGRRGLKPELTKIYQF